jgi:hypothetical protein
MAGNLNSLQIPRDLTKVIEVKDTSKVLYDFLVDVATKINELQTENKALTDRVTALENP